MRSSHGPAEVGLGQQFALGRDQRAHGLLDPIASSPAGHQGKREAPNLERERIGTLLESAGTP
jgi:hypothetical protein